MSKEKRHEKHSLFDHHIHLLPHGLHFRNCNQGHLKVLEKVNFKATAPVLRLGRVRDRSNATMPYTPGVKKPRLPPDKWHERASAQNPGQPRMKVTREGKLKVNPGVGRRLQWALAFRATRQRGPEPGSPEALEGQEETRDLRLPSSRGLGSAWSPRVARSESSISSTPPGCLSGRCRRRRRRRSCIH